MHANCLFLPKERERFYFIFVRDKRLSKIIIIMNGPAPSGAGRTKSSGPAERLPLEPLQSERDLGLGLRLGLSIRAVSASRSLGSNHLFKWPLV